MTVFRWSQTASSNATADTSINARENQAPSTINDAMRAMMAAVAKWRDDLSGNLVTGGTSSAYTITSNQVFTALTDGISVAARMNVTNGATPTLNVDGLGAKAIASVYGTAVGTGRLRAGGVYVFVYDSTDDKWIVQANPQEGFPTGTKMLFQQTAAPTGWTKDTTHDNKALRVVSGTAGSGGSTGFTTVFAARTIQRANLPNVTMTVTGTVSSTTTLANNTEVVRGNDGGTDPGPGGARGNTRSTITASTTSTFSNGVTSSLNGDVTQTTIDFAVAYVDLIIATKD